MKMLPALLVFSCSFAFVASQARADAKKDEVAGYIKDLKSKTAKTRATAAKELGHIGAVNASDTREAVPIILDLVTKDRDSGVRQAAAGALGRMDPDAEKAVPALTEALKDKIPGVCRNCVREFDAI